MNNLATLSFEKVQWAFPVAVTLHNLEEAIFIPAFWQHRSWHLAFTGWEFRFLAFAFSAVTFLVTYLSVHSGRKSAGAYMLVILSGVMFLNALWHIGATIYFQSYAPGVVTAVLLVMPVTAYLLYWATRQRYV
jgi:hypothetical protein